MNREHTGYPECSMESERQKQQQDRADPVKDYLRDTPAKGSSLLP
jgi:hypothetical protein